MKSEHSPKILEASFSPLERQPYTPPNLEFHNRWVAVNGVSPVIGPLSWLDPEESE
ncbi:MAG: hypothetical protein HC933_14345 [Pleurocapsa sp. SU_196_0]|nr:hypothetical protein [Pleurocapsa sp. SU_196_0]